MYVGVKHAPNKYMWESNTSPNKFTWGSRMLRISIRGGLICSQCVFYQLKMMVLTCYYVVYKRERIPSWRGDLPLLATVVAAKIAAAAAQDEKQRKNVAKTSHPVPVATGEQEQQEDDVVAPRAAIAEEAVHDMYLLSY